MQAVFEQLGFISSLPTTSDRNLHVISAQQVQFWLRAADMQSRQSARHIVLELSNAHGLQQIRFLSSYCDQWRNGVRMVHAQWVFGLPVSKAGCTDVLGVILTDGYLDRTGVCLNKVLPSHSSSLQNSWLHLSVVSVCTFWLGCLNSSADFILRAVHIHYSLAGWGSGGWKCKVFFLRTPLLPHPTLFCLFSPRKRINVACENLTTCKSALQNLSTWAEPECSSTQKAGHNFPSKIFSQGRKAIKLWLLVLKGLPHSLQVEFTYIKLQTSAIHRGKKSATSVFLFLFSLHHGRKPCLFLVARVWQKGAWRTYCSINQATFFLSHAAHSDGGHVHSGLCLRSVRMTNGPLNGRTSTGSSTWF